jgi:hypothetical protein
VDRSCRLVRRRDRAREGEEEEEEVVVVVMVVVEENYRFIAVAETMIDKKESLL